MRRGVGRLGLLGVFGISAIAFGGWTLGTVANEPVDVIDVSAADAALANPVVNQVDGQAEANGRAVSERPRPQPVMMDQRAAQAALDAVERNGVLGRLLAESESQGHRAADGGGLLPILHFVSCDESACPDVINWASANGLGASGVIVSFGHGGVEEYHVELVELVPPAAVQIVRRAEAVMNGVNAIGGASYDEWMADNRAYVAEAEALAVGGDANGDGE